MRATLKIDLNASSASEAQRILSEACEKLKSEGLIAECRFEINTPDGIVTDRCVLEGEKVIA